MKILNKTMLWVLAACCLLNLSCTDFLTENPKNRIDQNTYYKTEQDAIAAVNAIYAYLGAYNLDGGGPFPGNTAGVYHSTFWVTTELASDNMLNNQLGALGNDQLANFSYNSQNENLLEIWRIQYKVITLANVAISRIPAIEMNTALRDRLVNEAKFLRGLMYFNLTRLYKNVPLLLEENAALKPEAATQEAIYAQIILDLQDAEALPADGQTEEGRATQGAAQALLAKVYLTKGDHAQAAIYAQKVIDSKVYALWDDYADAFKLKNRGGKEAVFSVSFGDGGGKISFWEVGQFNVRLLPVELSNARSQVSNTQGWQTVTPHLYNSYHADDKRKAATYLSEITDDNGNVIKLSKIYIKKYWDEAEDPTAGGSYNDFPVIRYSDVLLTMAEAKAHTGDFAAANTFLNQVRTRAGLSAVNISSAESFLNEIMDQRRKEFIGEGHRWFDLVRTGKLNALVQAAKASEYPAGLPQLNENYYQFPIPQTERDVNPNLPQNPGY